MIYKQNIFPKFHYIFKVDYLFSFLSSFVFTCILLYHHKVKNLPAYVNEKFINKILIKKEQTNKQILNA